MGLRKGLKAVREAKQNEKQGEYGPRRVIMHDGDVMVCRFFGNFEDEEDPVLSTGHYVRRLPRKEAYNQCGDNTDQECVFCYQRDNARDKGIGKQDRANFFLWNFNRYHKLEEEVRDLRAGVVAGAGIKLKEGRDYRMTKYPRCRGKNCKWCQSGNEPLEEGFCTWELSTRYADQIVDLALVEAPKFCKCGAYEETEEGDRAGTIVIDSWLCGACEEEVDFDPDDAIPVASCSACKKKLPPMAVVSCSSCDDAQRCDLQDFKVRVKRIGEDKSTVYAIELLYPPKPPTEEELDTAIENYPDWEKLLAPDPVEVQAAKLGVVCPFESDGTTGAVAYDGDEDEVDSADEVDFTRGAPVKRTPIKFSKFSKRG